MTNSGLCELILDLVDAVSRLGGLEQPIQPFDRWRMTAKLIRERLSVGTELEPERNFDTIEHPADDRLPASGVRQHPVSHKR
jgi:hypothetical protein